MRLPTVSVLLLFLACSEAAHSEAPQASPKLAALDERDWLTDYGKCDTCHGAASLSGWASVADTMTAVILKRSAGYAYGAAGATKVLTLRASGTAERTVEVQGRPHPPGIGSFGAVANQRSTAILDPDQWLSLAERLASAGLFRHEAEVLLSNATHAEMAALTVSRSGRSDCTVASMHVLADTHHPTFARLLATIDALEGTLSWRDATR